MEKSITSAMLVLDFLYKLWPAFLAIFVVALIYWRTRSFSFLFYRIFKLLGLEGDYSNKDDERSTKEYLDLNKFNLKTGLRLKTVKAKGRLHEWMSHHDVELAELRHAGWIFKANKLVFEIPSVLKLWICSALVVCTAVIFIFLAAFFSDSSHSLLRVNATGTLFWVGNNEAFSLRYNLPGPVQGDRWKIDQYSCRYKDEPYPFEDSWDKNVICGLVLGLHDKFVSESIDSQRNAGVFLFVVGLILFLGVAIYAYWYNSSVALRLQMQEKESCKNHVLEILPPH